MNIVRQVKALEKSKTDGYFLKITGILIGVILAVWLVSHVSDHVRIVHLDNMYDPKYGYSVDAREEHFSQKFSSARDIETYLSDATILFSDPSLRNEVLFWRETQVCSVV